VIIVVEFQLYSRMVLVLAVSREWCDDVWICGRPQRGSISCGR